MSDQDTQGFPKLDIKAARALRPNRHTIIIDSILGGQGATTHFAGKNQFRASLGIDPSQPIDDADTVFSTMASGLLRPAASSKISGATIAAAPLWMRPNPKDGFTYVYDARGSAYSMDVNNSVAALSDGGSLSSSLGNGAEYCDNYMYFAKNTDVARYGPLNGAPIFDGSYWVTTLGKAALTNTAYPTASKSNIQLPNHFLHRHSNGRLFIADVVGNQGTLHYIATTKVAVEGDTNNSSTASAVTFGYGLWPTAIESYSSNIVVALIEASSTKKRDPVAKLAFVDATLSSTSQITWVEYPDPLITAIKNANGGLFIFSGNYKAKGFRVLQYIGGYSFKEVYYSEVGEPPLPGAVDAILNQILIGGYTTVPEAAGCVTAIGTHKAALGTGVFKIMRATGVSASTTVTAILPVNEGVATPIEMGFYTPTIAWTEAGDGSTGASHGIDQQGTAYNNAPSVWWSQLYKIGEPFKITKIIIPLVQAVAANMILTPTFYTDDGAVTTALPAISNSNYSGKRSIVMRVPGNVTGENNFWLELRWTGSVLLTVALPIKIEMEIITQ